MANLGTLYELTGNVDSAYYFIEQSMKINPDAHGGSEWVHLAVLRAKQQMQRNPNWIYQHQVLNLGLTDTVAQHSEQYEEILKKIWDISHQMEERIPFSPEPDLIVANIMRELGQLLETHVSIKDAYIAYRIAQVYDPLNSLNCIQKSEALLPLLIEHEYQEMQTTFEEHFPPKRSFESLSEEYYEAYEKKLHKEYVHTKAEVKKIKASRNRHW